jgi:hypothetical protein
MAVLLQAQDLPGVRVPKRQNGLLMRLYVLDTKENRYISLGKPLKQ